MAHCFFVTDLHGRTLRYNKLFSLITDELPSAIFFGGDLLPHRLRNTEGYSDFTLDFLFPQFIKLKELLKDKAPAIFLILGNDDARSEECKFIKGHESGLFNYLSQIKKQFIDFSVYGYPFVPPTPFQLKDWEKYDVSRYVDPGCIPPTEGFRTAELTDDIEYATIEQDLKSLTGDDDLSQAIFLFHSPPYRTLLDRASLDGKTIDHVPLDVHVGSIAIKSFIEERQPLITLHGHIHESTRITGHWKELIGKTFAFNGSHDGPELAVVKFNPENPSDSKRILI
jgi:Icc-related predicted phosphoesterase